MSLKIVHKNSSSSGTPPASGDIDVGELAINAADAELYTKDLNGNIRKLTGTADGVKFTQAGSGAVQRTVDSKLKDVVSVKDFGAVGDGVADDTAAIQNALNSGAKSVLLPKGTYLSSQLTIPSGIALRSNDGATIKAISAISAMLAGATNATEITIYGLTLDGNGLAGYGMLFAGGSVLRVENNRVTDVTEDGIRVQAATDVRIIGNTVFNVSKLGITLTLNVTDFAVSQNIVNGPARAGIVFSAAQRGVISSNVITAIGPDGDGITGYHHQNADVAITGNVIKDSLNHGIHVGGERITVTGNTTRNSDNSGIYIGANLNGSSANPREPSNHITVSNNVVDTTVQWVGMWINTCHNCTVSGNSVYSASNQSILLEDSTSTVISSNIVKDGQEAGIVLRNSNNCSLSANLAKNPRTNGYRVEAGSSYNHFSGNLSDGSVTTAAAYFEASTCNFNIFLGNAGQNLSSALFGRAGANTRWLLGYPNTATVASAGALAIDSTNDFFEVTGTTTITSILQSPVAGRKITLWFRDTLTLGGNVNNLRLNGGTTFSAADGRTMTLVGDGTNWREVGRGTAPA
jgi:parallel beta-helix repeat protein